MCIRIRIFIAFSLLIIFSGSANAIVVALPLDQLYQSDEVIQAKVEALEKSLHEKAKEIPAVCAVLIDDPSDDLMDLATGTYFAKVGNSGFVLTAAHIAVKAKNRLQFLSLSFNSGYRNVKNRIAATKVYVYPDYNPALGDSEKYISINDIAIIEFDSRKLPPKILPVSLDNKDYSNFEGEPIEGAILGYGKFGTNITTLQDLDTVHFGKTYAYFYTDATIKKKLPVFKVNLPHLYNFYPSITDLYRFATTFPSSMTSSEGNNYPSASSFQLILQQDKVHLQQGFLAPGGDDGGPLLFMDKKNPGKFRLAGIAQSSGVGVYPTLYVANRNVKTAYIIWEPVFIYEDWIKKIVEKQNTTDCEL